MIQTYHEWLQAAEVGEVVSVMTTTKGSKYHDTWATYEFTSARIEDVTRTHVRAGGQLFRKTKNASGDAGYSTAGDKLIRSADFKHYELLSRLRTARNALKDARDSQTRWLLSTLSDLLVTNALTEQLISAVENVVERQKAVRREAKSVADMLHEETKKFWEAKSGR